MNRYLFRGKRLDNGEWVEGSLCRKRHKPNEYEVEWVYSIQKHQPQNGTYYLYEVYEVDPKTVGQYTGLTDKNGKKIFEGDNVLYDRNINSKTDKLIFTVCWNGNGYELDGGWFDEDMTSPELLEIIGNIYESEVS